MSRVAGLLRSDAAVARRAPSRPGTLDGAAASMALPAMPRPAARSKAMLVAPLLVLANLAVFGAWLAATPGGALADHLSARFTVSAAHLAEGEYAALLGSVFSHRQPWHLLVNVVVILGFGAVLERIWGRRVFLALFLCAGVAGSLAHCATATLILGRDDLRAVGASGAVAGLLVAFALSYPRQPLLVLGLVRLPALVAAVGLFAADVIGLVAQGSGGGVPIGHGAHLGGAAAGLVFYLLYGHRSRSR